MTAARTTPGRTGDGPVRCAVRRHRRTAQGPIDLRGDLHLARPRRRATRRGRRVVVGGVVADVVAASPQGRGRWSWQAVADARLFIGGRRHRRVAGRGRRRPAVVPPLDDRAAGAGLARPRSARDHGRPHSLPARPSPSSRRTASPLIGHLDPVRDRRSIDPHRRLGARLAPERAGHRDRRLRRRPVHRRSRAVDRAARRRRRPGSSTPPSARSAAWARFQRPDRAAARMAVHRLLHRPAGGGRARGWPTRTSR